MTITALPREQLLAQMRTCRAIEALMLHHGLPVLADCDPTGHGADLTLPRGGAETWRRALDDAEHLTATVVGGAIVHVKLREAA